MQFEILQVGMNATRQAHANAQAQAQAQAQAASAVQAQLQAARYLPLKHSIPSSLRSLDLTFNSPPINSLNNRLQNLIYSDHLQYDNTCTRFEQALQLLPPNAHHSQRPTNFHGGDPNLGN